MVDDSQGGGIFLPVAGFVIGSDHEGVGARGNVFGDKVEGCLLLSPEVSVGYEFNGVVVYVGFVVFGLKGNGLGLCFGEGFWEREGKVGLFGVDDECDGFGYLGCIACLVGGSEVEGVASRIEGIDLVGPFPGCVYGDGVYLVFSSLFPFLIEGDRAIRGIGVFSFEGGTWIVGVGGGARGEREEVL